MCDKIQIPFSFRTKDGSCVYSQLNNDVGLMKLDAPVMLNDFVNTICLPGQSKTAPVGTRCYITGRFLSATSTNILWSNIIQKLQDGHESLVFINDYMI